MRRSGSSCSKLVWSYGGGLQSVAIAVLIRDGRLPRPDLAVIADTGREASSTWTYLAETLQPYLTDLPIERAPHTLATVDLYAKNGDLLIPAYTSKGALPTFCSNEWKRRVVARYLRGRGITDCDLWLGISLDELERMRTGADPTWMRNRYPLIDLRLTRADCMEIVRVAGLPRPQKSACYMCPFHNNAEWRSLAPADFQRAVDLERAIKAQDPDLWLHPSRRPLAEVDLEEKPSGQIELFCDSGFCFT